MINKFKIIIFIFVLFIFQDIVVAHPPPQGMRVNLYRYGNSSIQNHFYTIDKHDVQHTSGYNFVRIEGQVFSSGRPGTVPLYRYYRTQTYKHFYTTDWNELRNGSGDYRYEGVACYVFPRDRQYPGTIPLYRYYNIGNGAHFYTTTPQAEILNGFRYERIECYIFPSTCTSDLYH